MFSTAEVIFHLTSKMQWLLRSTFLKYGLVVFWHLKQKDNNRSCFLLVINMKVKWYRWCWAYCLEDLGFFPPRLGQVLSVYASVLDSTMKMFFLLTQRAN